MLNKNLSFHVNGDGTISAEYDDDRYYYNFGDYTIDELKTFLFNLEDIIVEAQDQLYWYNSINEVKRK